MYIRAMHVVVTTDLRTSVFSCYRSVSRHTCVQEDSGLSARQQLQSTTLSQTNNFEL